MRRTWYVLSVGENHVSLEASDKLGQRLRTRITVYELSSTLAHRSFFFRIQKQFVGQRTISLKSHGKFPNVAGKQTYHREISKVTREIFPSSCPFIMI
jgi:hypothetical protein